MVHGIDYEIVGDDMQALIITLDQDEKVRAEAGAMMFMEQNIEMDTGTGGGLFKGLKRALAGESFFITTFTCSSGRSRVCFGGPHPGKIIPLDLADTRAMLCQRDAFLAAAYGIDIEVAFTRRLGAGFFGGEGFILQRITGPSGWAFIHAGGTVMEKVLQAGEHIKVDTGCLVAFQESVDYDIEMIKGFKSALFGGEGLFLARLTGPGRVYLQTLPFSRLADRVIGASRSSSGEVKRGGGISGMLGDLIGGDR